MAKSIKIKLNALIDSFESLDIDVFEAVKEYRVYKINNFENLVLFPDNILQEKWDCSFKELKEQILNGAYNSWISKEIYDII